jgi:hypothetical protein
MVWRVESAFPEDDVMAAHKIVLGLFVATCIAWAGLAPAQEPSEPAAGESLRPWIEQLDADRFADRQAASEKLKEAGIKAVPALAEAAETGAPETIARAVDLLADLLTKGDVDAKTSAKTALEKLAAGPNAIAARRAKAALEENEKPQPMPQPAIGRALPLQIFGNNLRVAGGQVQIQVQANNGAQVRRMTVVNNNGVRQIEAEENGRTVKIKDDPNGVLEMEVTETKDGKPVTQKYQAKNADDLKQKHPEAHKLFEQYNNQAQAQARAAANPIQRSMQARIQSLEVQLQSLQRTLAPLEAEAGKTKADAIKKHLENVQKEIDEAKKKLAEEPKHDGPQEPAP